MIQDCVADATEEWRPVVGFADVYEVSNLGRAGRNSCGAGQFWLAV